MDQKLQGMYGSLLLYAERKRDVCNMYNKLGESVEFINYDNFIIKEKFCQAWNAVISRDINEYLILS